MTAADTVTTIGTLALIICGVAGFTALVVRPQRPTSHLRRRQLDSLIEREEARQ